MRSDREDGDAAELARQSLATLATNEVVKSLEVVTQLRDDPGTPAKTRLDAAIFVLGLWGVAPSKVGEVSLRPTETNQKKKWLPKGLIESLSNEQLNLAERAFRDEDLSPLIASFSADS